MYNPRRFRSRSGGSQSAGGQVLIAVLGVTGAGKSTFINKATGTNAMEVGHSIFSCTDSVTGISTTIDGKNVVLIDTPGFDDAERTDADVLQEIANWLAESYRHGVLLDGMILLQPVDGNRAFGSEARRTCIFKQICGPDAFSHVVIGTTMWSKIRNKAYGRRQVEERKSSDEFWADLVKRGAMITEHQDTQSSAINIIRKIVNKGKTTLQLQRELAERDGEVFRTTAGQQLFYDLGQSSARENEKLNRLIQEIRFMRASNEKYREEIEQLRDQIDVLEDQRDTLKTSKVQVSASQPEWVKTLAGLGTVAVTVGSVAIPLAATGTCSIL